MVLIVLSVLNNFLLNKICIEKCVECSKICIEKCVNEMGEIKTKPSKG